MTVPNYPWTKEEVQVIKAAWVTDASRPALLLIVERLGNLHGASFDSDPSLMAFHEGRRFVGRELMAAINQPVEKLVKETDEPRSNRPITATERAIRAASSSDNNPRAVKRR